MQARRDNLPNVLDTLSHQLHILSKHSDPEEAGRYLAVPTNNREVNEDRAAMLEELRDALPWLQRVLEEADVHARQRQRYDEAPKLGSRGVCKTLNSYPTG
jgi:hypothetical protein